MSDVKDEKESLEVSLLIHILARIEQKASTVYKNIDAFTPQSSITMKNIARVMAKEEERHAQIYLELLEKPESKLQIPREEFMKMKENFDDLQELIRVKHFRDAEEMYRFVFDLEKLTVRALEAMIRVIRKMEMDEASKVNFIAFFEMILREEKKHVHHTGGYLASLVKPK
jgi:rubrerythrin